MQDDFCARGRERRRPVEVGEAEVEDVKERVGAHHRGRALLAKAGGDRVEELVDPSALVGREEGAEAKPPLVGEGRLDGPPVAYGLRVLREPGGLFRRRLPATDAI
jgi:hypothetical protein